MMEILEKNNINYQTQVTFKDCKYKKRLPFDFGIYNKENKLEYLIEMQGEHHFLEGKHGRWNVDNVRKTDTIKKKYCNNKNIDLIEIDCKKSDFNYIIGNIKRTNLKFLLYNINYKDLKNSSLIRNKNINVEYLINLYLLGVSYTKISLYFNTSTFIITNTLKKLGYYNKERRKLNPVVHVKDKIVLDSLQNQQDVSNYIYVEEYVYRYGFCGLSCRI